MALNYSAIEALVKKNYLPTVVDNIYKASPILARLREKADVQDGGSKIVQPVRYSKGTSGSYSGFTQFNINPVDQHTAAEFDWKQYFANITITGEEEAKINGDNAVVRLVEQKVADAEKDLREDLSNGIYNDPTSEDTIGLDGFKHMINNTGIYGGIDRATDTWWVPGLVDTNPHEASGLEDPTSADYLPKLIRAGIKATTVNNEKPSLIVTDPDTFDILADILDEKQRFTDPKLADLGFESIRVTGVLVVPDSLCPANHIFFLNEEYVKLIEHSNKRFTMSPFVKPADRDGQVAQIFWMGNLVASSLRHLGKYTKIGLSV